MGLPDTALPADKLPQCWSDDVRMNALFAPFRLKSVNPESWEMKMKFWSDMVRQWCKHKKDPLISAADIKFAFQRKGRTPACIDIVLEEMFRNNELAPISKYQQILHNGPEGWMRWGVRLAFKPASIALSAATMLLPARQAVDNNGMPKASIDSTQRFVVESSVKELAKDLIQNFPAGEDRIGTIEELMRACSWKQSKDAFEVLLGYLVMTNSAVKKGEVIKLAEPNKTVSVITETDEALVKLMTAESRLEQDSSRLVRDIASAEAEARAAMKLGNKMAAKGHLRRKHRSQQRLDRCDAALENVRQLLQTAREVTVNAEILDTYKTSSQAMKTGMKTAGLDDENVHNTMDELKEVMDSYNEVEKALGGTVEDLDQSELEAELEELLAGAPGSGGTPQKDEREGRKKNDELPKLPTPPASLPKNRKVSERDFIFDGEARMLAELNELSDNDNDDDVPDEKRKTKTPQKIKQTSQPWYPESTKSVWGDKQLDCMDRIADGFSELTLDQRIHPGQQLSIDSTSPPNLYSTDFQVKDHKTMGSLWLYSDSPTGDLTMSTDYTSASSPGKLGGAFQMAPGGERKKTWPQKDDVDELERRLKDLRGYKS